MKTEETTKKQIKFEDLNYKDQQTVIKQRQGMGIIVHRNIHLNYTNKEKLQAKEIRKAEKKEQSKLAKIERRKKLKISN